MAGKLGRGAADVRYPRRLCTECQGSGVKMTLQDKRRIMFLIFFTGFVCIMMVVLSALSAEIRHENNELISQNEELSGEVETISVKIKSINSVEHIEEVAKEELGMVYPDSDQCVVITEKDAPGENFAAAIRKQAYN